MANDPEAETAVAAFALQIQSGRSPKSVSFRAREDTVAVESLARLAASRGVIVGSVAINCRRICESPRRRSTRFSVSVKGGAPARGGVDSFRLCLEVGGEPNVE